MRLGQGLIPMAVVSVQGGCKQVHHCGSGGKGKTESGRVDVNPVAPGYLEQAGDQTIPESVYLPWFLPVLRTDGPFLFPQPFSGTRAGCSLPVQDQSSLSWPLGPSVSSVSPSSGKQYVPAKVRSGRARSSLSEVSMEGRESRKIYWSPVLTHHGELLLILIFSANTSISRPHFGSEVFCLNLLKPHPRRTAGAGGPPGIPRSGGHGSALRFCLKLGSRREAVGTEKSQAIWSVRWSSQERAFPALPSQPS